MLNRKFRKKFNCSRRVGVEWEYNHLKNNTSTNHVLNTWISKWRGNNYTDGSCGYEAVTPPIAGDNIQVCLEELFNAFKEGGAKIDSLCGTHVHVDASDLTWIGVKRLIMLYAKIEPLLYLIGGQHRAANCYCSPCGQEYMNKLVDAENKNLSYKTAIMHVALGYKQQLSTQTDIEVRSQMKFRPSKKGGARYKGLNIMPWLSGRYNRAPDTTIEFRIHRNVKELDRIVCWAQLCAKIVDYAYNASTDQQIENLPTSPLQILCNHVAPELKDWILKRIKAWRKATEFSNEFPIKRRISFTNGWKFKNLV